jgi:putative heme-binding domain-containing protein
MRRLMAALVAATTCLAGGAMLIAQAEPPATNPLAGDAAAVQAGMMFRSRGAPTATAWMPAACGGDPRRWAWPQRCRPLPHPAPWRPGTEMPSVGPRIRRRGLEDPASQDHRGSNATDVVTGNAQHGQQVFRAQCAGCHRVNGVGGRLGPDLSRIGAARARGAIVRRVRGATEDFLDGYEPVIITLKNGQTVRGVRKNGDLFSVQIMDGRERIQGYLKSDVREVAAGKASAMPVFDVQRLSESDLNDLLAWFATLKGFDPSVQ